MTEKASKMVSGVGEVHATQAQASHQTLPSVGVLSAQVPLAQDGEVGRDSPTAHNLIGGFAMRPAPQRRAGVRPAHTVSDLFTARLAQIRAGCRATTLQKAEYLIGSILMPWLGTDRLVDDLTRGEVQEWIYKPNQTRRPAHTRNCVGIGRAAYNEVGRAYEWTDRNPFEAVKLPPAPVRGRVLTDQEITDSNAWLAAEQIMGAHPSRRQAAHAIQCLALVGARRDEILYLDWIEVDLDNGLIVLPPDRHKAGRKTGKEKVIYLSPDAVAFLRMRGPSESGRVFKCSYGTLRRTFERMRGEIGAPDITMHDLRRTYSTLLAEAGVDAADVAAVLGQKSVQVQRRHYRHVRAPRLREIATLGGSLMTQKGEDHAHEIRPS